MFYFPAVAGITLKYLKNKPLIFNPIVDENNIIYRKIYSQTIAKQAIKRADCNILLTDYSLLVLQRYGFELKEYAIIPPGVDIAEFENIEDEYIEQYKKKDCINILYAGRLATGKGIDILLNAFLKCLSKQKNLHLHISGADFGFKQKILDFITKNNLKEKITVYGLLPRSKLVALFKAADIFVLPSNYEAFGIVLIEAMAAGAAVIGSNVSAIPFVIDNEKTGLLFEKNNADDLSEKILYLIDNPNKTRELLQNGARLVAEKYSWQKISEDYAKIYRRFGG